MRISSVKTWTHNVHGSNEEHVDKKMTKRWIKDEMHVKCHTSPHNSWSHAQSYPQEKTININDLAVVIPVIPDTNNNKQQLYIN